jgi:sigma-54 dependent transcriptional regulator, acetoin dehydrogenase operon transcriptional activator AcoR
MANALGTRHSDDVMRIVHSLPRPGRELPDRTIARSWIRCATDYRLDPSRPDAPTIIEARALADRREQFADLMQIGTAEVDRLYDQISGSGYALLLTDASGIILYEKVDPTLKDLFRGAGLVPGADWSERSRGTNGMGTCLAERKPVTVHRNDHFYTHHIGLTCFGVPIRGPVDDLIAVLDASCIGSHDTKATQMHTMALVRLSAHIIEKCLFLRHHEQNAVLRFHSRPDLVNLFHDGALALAEDGTVIGADHTAAQLLEAKDRYELVGRPIGEIFDVEGARGASLEILRSASLSPLRDPRRGQGYYANLYTGSNHPHAETKSVSRPVPEVVKVPASPSPPVLTLEDLAGEDPQMLRNVRSARRIADSGVSVLIQGATGSGKEAFAHAMHSASLRAGHPFVAVNCAAIPETLIESELFGYKPGAFTGARKEGMKGKILQSSGGTLFLDEIGDMPLSLQTRLLRVLEEQEIVPLGSEVPIKVDLHVIAASHRNLREMISRGEFREDLYYRLNGITLELPRLMDRADRERVIHRALAAETHNGRPAAIEMDALQRLISYPWPGNIRELRNVIRTALAICEGGVVRLIDLPREIREPHHTGATLTTVAPASSAAATPLESEPLETCANPLAAAERAALLRVIEKCRGNMTHAAEHLGVSRNTLYRKMKTHGIPTRSGS